MTATAAEAASAKARPPLKTLALRTLVAGGLAGGIFLLYALQIPTCQFAKLTGRPCPGCGLTRGSLAISHLHLAEAFALQPFAFIVPPMLALFVSVPAVNFIRTGRPSFSQKSGVTAAAIAIVVSVAMVAFWMARFYGFWGGPVPV